MLFSLQEETDEVVKAGDRLITQIDYPGDDIAQGKRIEEWLDPQLLHDIKKRGTVIVRGVIPPEVALGYKQSVRDYVTANPHTKGFPEGDPQVFELYWSKAQLAARSELISKKESDFR